MSHNYPFLGVFSCWRLSWGGISNHKGETKSLQAWQRGIHMNRAIDDILIKLKDVEAQAIIITSPTNRRYLTGFTGSAGTVWISNGKKALLTDFRYIEQAKGQCPGWEIVQIDEMEKSIAEMIEAENINNLAIEAPHVTVSQLKASTYARSHRNDTGSGIADASRKRKDHTEIE